MEKLKEIHRKIKEHTYRISENKHYLKGYKEFLFQLSHEFYVAIKETRYNIAKNLVHDFNAAISNLGRENYKYSAENDFHVEYCISVIHRFIETEEVPEFSTFHPNPTSFLSILGAQKKYIWNEELEGYYLYVPKDKISLVSSLLENNIKEISKKIKMELGIPQ